MCPCVSFSDTWWPALGRCFGRVCPHLKRFLASGQGEFAWTKGFFGFLFGLLLGYAFYWTVIEGMMFSQFIRLSLGGAICIALGFGYALSIQVRCISLIVIPTFCGKSGRSYIQTFAIALIITGPIANIIYHAGEVSRGMSCAMELSANMSSTLLELKLRPIQEIMADLQSQSSTVHERSQRIKTEFSPIEKEVEDDRETANLKSETDAVDGTGRGTFSRTKLLEKKYRQYQGADRQTKKQKQYERKLDYRCEDVYNIGVKNCRKTFRESEEKCQKQFKLFSLLLCFPFKMTVICELARLLPAITGVNCNAMEAVNPGFGEGYSAADDSANNFDKNFDVKMQYKVETKEEALNVNTAQDVGKAIAYEFKARKEWFDFVMLLIKRFMAFLFVRVFLSSFKYHQNYATNIHYDNHYMTSYFRHIEKRRIYENKNGLLPLKQMEANHVIESTKCSLTSQEKSKLVTTTMALILRVITILVIFFIDYLIYDILYIIYTNSHVEYRQTGVHHIKLEIYGNGAIGNLVRSMLRGFNKKHAIDRITSNFQCLPRPVELPKAYIYKVMGIYAGIWLLMLLQAFGLRLRRCIAAFFYPKREKKRILFLYNDMLKKRRGHFHHMRGRVKSLARENKLSMSTGLLMSWRHAFPRLCCVLRLVGLGKKQCLVCKEPENKEFHYCRTKGCNFVYCRSCWIDLKEKCYACLDKEDFSSDSYEDDWGDP